LRVASELDLRVAHRGELLEHVLEATVDAGGRVGCAADDVTDGEELDAALTGLHGHAVGGGGRCRREDRDGSGGAGDSGRCTEETTSAHAASVTRRGSAGAHVASSCFSRPRG